MTPLPFIPGYPSEPTGLLARYLPPLPEGVAAAYIERYSAPGDLILDPFGQSPRIAVEAAGLGRRVVVVNRNPVIQFAHRVACDPPPEALARTALTRLADAPTAGGSVEQAVRAMYRTICPECGQLLDPEFFAWEEDVPFEKRLICDVCGEDKVRPTNAEDVEQAARYPVHAPGYFWALDRVAPPDDPDREHVAHALQAYTPRALQAIFALATKMEALALEADMQRALQALLLLAFDEANSLWPYPSERGRPKTLKPHQSHCERNIWLALEKGVAAFGAAQPMRVVTLDELLASREAGVAIVDIPISALQTRLDRGQCTLALTALPRPNPVLWVLSVVWAGWLWDTAVDEGLKRLLRRRRYDWVWHERALRKTLPAIRPLLRHDAPFVGLLPESEPSFLAAALTAADGAGYALQGLTLQPDDSAAQVLWQPEADGATLSVRDLPGAMRQPAADEAISILEARAEPTPAAVVHAAAIAALAQQRILRAAAKQNIDDLLAVVNAEVASALQQSPALIQLDEKPTPGQASGLWWLAAPPANEAALSDRTEQIVAQHLASHAEMMADDILAKVFEELPGLLTPSLKWIQRCLRSYGEEIEPERWRCRPEDIPAARELDQEEIRNHLTTLGERLGFQVRSEDTALDWMDGERSEYTFIVLATAAIGRPLLEATPAAERPVLVVPGGRAGMIQYRLQHDPRLRQAVETHAWTFLKYRHVRRLVAEADLDRTSLNTVLGLDPIVEQPSAQIPLL